MNPDVNLARCTFNHFNRLDMWIKLLPLTGPVGTNLFFSNRAMRICVSGMGFLQRTCAYVTGCLSHYDWIV